LKYFFNEKTFVVSILQKMLNIIDNLTFRSKTKLLQ